MVDLRLSSLIEVMRLLTPLMKSEARGFERAQGFDGHRLKYVRGEKVPVFLYLSVGSLHCCWTNRTTGRVGDVRGHTSNIIPQTIPRLSMEWTIVVFHAK